MMTWTKLILILTLVYATSSNAYDILYLEGRRLFRSSCPD
jgi:hypothetical protein